MNILLWLAELIGGVVLRQWFERLLGRREQEPTAQSIQLEARNEQQKAVIKEQKEEVKVDQTVSSMSDSSIRSELHNEWTDEGDK